jgi:hypothetical protein
MGKPIGFRGMGLVGMGMGWDIQTLKHHGFSGGSGGFPKAEFEP